MKTLLIACLATFATLGACEAAGGCDTAKAAETKAEACTVTAEACTATAEACAVKTEAKPEAVAAVATETAGKDAKDCGACCPAEGTKAVAKVEDAKDAEVVATP